LSDRCGIGDIDAQKTVRQLVAAFRLADVEHIDLGAGLG